MGDEEGPGAARQEDGSGRRRPASVASPAPHPATLIPGRVVSIGVDLVDVDRVRDALARHPGRFTNRVLTPTERDYCLSRPDPAPHVAARFAAKEAVIKCLGGGCGFADIEVVRALTGFPSITLRGRALKRAGSRNVLVSLSHLPHLAAAFAVLVEPEPAP